MHLLLALVVCCVALAQQVEGVYFVAEIYSKDDDTCAKESRLFIMAGYIDSNETEMIVSPCVALDSGSGHMSTYVALTFADVEHDGMEWGLRTYETEHCLGTVISVFYGKTTCLFDGTTRGQFLLDAANFTRIELATPGSEYNGTDCPDITDDTWMYTYPLGTCSGTELKERADALDAAPVAAAHMTNVGMVLALVLLVSFFI